MLLDAGIKPIGVKLGVPYDIFEYYPDSPVLCLRQARFTQWELRFILCERDTT